MRALRDAAAKTLREGVLQRFRKPHLLPQRPPMPALTRQQVSECLSPTCPVGEVIAALKVHEQSEGDKTRYIVLSVTSEGWVRLHKAKLKSNGMLSVGKIWGLEELMALEVASPQAFAITLGIRSYLWQTDSPAEQINFLVALVRSFRLFTGNRALRTVGFDVRPESTGSPPPYSVPRIDEDASRHARGSLSSCASSNYSAMAPTSTPVALDVS